ncbi:MAG: helix-turn-helix domain-containing protein [Saprospiraceae bacterium]
MKDLINNLEKLIELRQALRESYEVVSTTGQKNKFICPETSFLQEIKKIVDEKISDENLDIEYLSKELQLSPTQLFRKMKALTNLAPMKFVNKIRLQKAKTLIETTSLNISEVAYGLGFNDPNYFSRAFRKEFKIAPTGVRKLVFASL